MSSMANSARKTSDALTRTVDERTPIRTNWISSSWGAPLYQAATTRIKKNDIKLIPCAHAEGKLLFPLEKQEKYIDQLEKNDQIVFRYVDPDGNYAGYPWNPNGSISNIAGICNHHGNVFGMMPHPERSFFQHQHPNWTNNGLSNNIGDGREIFESVIDYISKKF